MLVGHRPQRLAVALGDHAHHSERGLDGDRVDLAEERVHQLQAADLDVARAAHVALQVAHDHVVHELRLDVGPDRDHARTAEREDGHDHVVVAGVHAEVVGEVLRHRARVRDVARGLLDAHDVGVRAEARDVVLRDGAARATGDVVEDHGQVHVVEHGEEVLVDAFLVGLVVVRGDEQQAVDAQLGQTAGLGQRLVRGVGARAADHGDAAGDILDHALGHGVVLGVGHRRRLARRAEHEDAVGVILQVEVDQAVERGEVDLPILIERGDERDDRAFESTGIHSGFLSIGASPTWEDVRCLAVLLLE